jgi:hypothetical protein
MTRISSAVVVAWKFSGPFVLFVGNFIIITTGLSHEQFNYEALIAFNGAIFCTLGLLSLYAFQLWDVDVDGQTVIAKRFKKVVEFNLGDIRKITITPNILDRDDTMTPFVNIILNKKKKGFYKIKYYPSSNRKDEELLIDPWHRIYQDWVQESLKRRKARR